MSGGGKAPVPFGPFSQNGFPQTGCRSRTLDRFDPLLERLLVELDPAEEVSVIRDRHGRGAELLGSVHEGIDCDRTVEEGILGVKVKVNELRGRHGTQVNVPPGKGNEKLFR